MASSKSTDHLDFVSRQLASLLRKEQLEPALQKLTEASPPEYARDVEYMRKILSGHDEAGPRQRPNPYKAIEKLLPSVSGPKNTLFREFVAYVQQSKLVFETYSSAASGMRCASASARSSSEASSSWSSTIST